MSPLSPSNLIMVPDALTQSVPTSRNERHRNLYAALREQLANGADLLEVAHKTVWNEKWLIFARQNDDPFKNREAVKVALVPGFSGIDHKGFYGQGSISCAGPLHHNSDIVVIAKTVEDGLVAIRLNPAEDERNILQFTDVSNDPEILNLVQTYTTSIVYLYKTVPLNLDRREAVYVSELPLQAVTLTSPFATNSARVTMFQGTGKEGRNKGSGSSRLLTRAEFERLFVKARIEVRNLSVSYVYNDTTTTTLHLTGTVKFLFCEGYVEGKDGHFRTTLPGAAADYGHQRRMSKLAYELYYSMPGAVSGSKDYRFGDAVVLCEHASRFEEGLGRTLPRYGMPTPLNSKSDENVRPFVLVEIALTAGKITYVNNESVETIAPNLKSVYNKLSEQSRSNFIIRNYDGVFAAIAREFGECASQKMSTEDQKILDEYAPVRHAQQGWHKLTLVETKQDVNAFFYCYDTRDQKFLPITGNAAEIEPGREYVICIGNNITRQTYTPGHFESVSHSGYKVEAISQNDLDEDPVIMEKFKEEVGHITNRLNLMSVRVSNLLRTDEKPPRPVTMDQYNKLPKAHRRPTVRHEFVLAKRHSRNIKYVARLRLADYVKSESRSGGRGDRVTSKPGENDVSVVTEIERQDFLCSEIFGDMVERNGHWLFVLNTNNLLNQSALLNADLTDKMRKCAQRWWERLKAIHEIAFTNLNIPNRQCQGNFENMMKTTWCQNAGLDESVVSDVSGVACSATRSVQMDLQQGVLQQCLMDIRRIRETHAEGDDTTYVSEAVEVGEWECVNS